MNALPPGSILIPGNPLGSLTMLEYECPYCGSRQPSPRQRYALSERDGHLEWAVGELERLRNILKMIAEMPASTHAIDAELCREALS